jgi:hypothetical protein
MHLTKQPDYWHYQFLVLLNLHLKFGQMNDFIWDLFCSSRSASSNFNFLKDEDNTWSADKKSVWFTTLVEVVA